MGANFVLQTTPNDEQNARSRRILEAMLRSCAQMERLVRNFADLSEIEGGAVNLRLGLHDVGEMLDIAAEAARESARLRSVEIVVNKPDQRVAMCCDRDRVVRALGHLVDNAVKAAPEGSAVTLALTERGEDVELSVTDHGAGLAPQVRRNLFDREWHAKRANRVGAGFGLAIARGFAIAHGGKLHVDSRASATSFTLVLPKAGPAEAVPAAARSRSDRPRSPERARTGKRARAGA
jgi:signal transduction histidine kinase